VNECLGVSQSLYNGVVESKGKSRIRVWFVNGLEEDGDCFGRLRRIG
jgi:hypothetical protein